MLYIERKSKKVHPVFKLDKKCKIYSQILGYNGNERRILKSDKYNDETKQIIKAIFKFVCFQMFKKNLLQLQF